MKMFDVYAVYPLSIVRGRGSWVWDEAGERYLDMYGGHAVISIGHSQPDYVAAVSEQLGQLGFYSNSVIIRQQALFAEALGAVSGLDGLGASGTSGGAGGGSGAGFSGGSGGGGWQLFMCNSGAEANENALKLASFHTGRRLVVSIRGAFHGRTSLAVAATDNLALSAPVNEANNVIFSELNDAAALERLFAERGSEVAAVIVEAIQGVAGIRVATAEFLQTVRRLCTAHGAVWVADEIQCGGGRTGRYFATSWAGVEADIYTMAKGIGNGFPMGALAIAPFFEPRTGMLGTTFGGNQLACAAGTAVARVMLRDGLVANAAAVGEYLIDELRALPGVREVRGRGLMIGLEFEEDAVSGAPIENAARRLLFEQKMFVGTAQGGRVIRLLPALSITRDEAARAVEAIGGLLASC